MTEYIYQREWAKENLKGKTESEPLLPLKFMMLNMKFNRGIHSFIHLLHPNLTRIIKSQWLLLTLRTSQSPGESGYVSSYRTLSFLPLPLLLFRLLILFSFLLHSLIYFSFCFCLYVHIKKNSHLNSIRAINIIGDFWKHSYKVLLTMWLRNSWELRIEEQQDVPGRRTLWRWILGT